MTKSPNTPLKPKSHPKSNVQKLKLNSTQSLTIAVSAVVVIFVLAGCIGGRIWYQRHHIYSSYGLNKAGNIIFNKQLQPKGWDYSADTSATNAHSESLARFIPGQPYEDSQAVTIQKVDKSSMKFSQAATLEESLRSEKTQSLKAAGYGIHVLPSSSIVVRVGSKHVRLQTVEFSEFYTFRFEESDAFYVQDGYYIDIQRSSTTMGNAHPNHSLLMNQTNTALDSFSIGSK